MSAEYKEGDKKCVLCSIVEGTVPCDLITESEKSIAIISLEGTPLVLPKKHVDQSNVEDSLEDMIDVYALANKLEPSVRRAYSAQAINLLENRGKEAGQEISHYHMHIMPRRRGDKLLTIGKKTVSSEDRKLKAESLRKLFSDNVG